MSPLTLFDSPDGTLANDERGRIEYVRSFVDASTAGCWFMQLRREVNWRTDRRQMFDREVDVPRLLGHYRLDSVPSSAPAAIWDAAARVNARLNVPFNSVGLNLYRNGADSVAPHNDHLY